MARPGKFDHLKPEILRLLAEGVTQAEILRQHPGIPKGTLSLWASSVAPVRNNSERSSEPPKPRLPIDPESPLEKIKNALWDIVYEPQGKGAAVQALNILLKIEAPWLLGVATPAPDDDEAVKEINITRRVVDAKP
jgi:hypothetical protein